MQVLLDQITNNVYIFFQMKKQTNAIGLSQLKSIPITDNVFYCTDFHYIFKVQNLDCLATETSTKMREQLRILLFLLCSKVV